MSKPLSDNTAKYAIENIMVWDMTNFLFGDIKAVCNKVKPSVEWRLRTRDHLTKQTVSLSQTRHESVQFSRYIFSGHFYGERSYYWRACQDNVPPGTQGPSAGARDVKPARRRFVCACFKAQYSARRRIHKVLGPLRTKVR